LTGNRPDFLPQNDIRLEDLPAAKILRILGKFDAPLHGPGILFVLAFQIVSPQKEKERNQQRRVEENGLPNSLPLDGATG